MTFYFTKLLTLEYFLMAKNAQLCVANKHFKDFLIGT